MQDYTAIKDTVAICRDAEQGFRGAANAVKTPALRGVFEQLSAERAGFANELLHAARSMGLEIDNPIGVAGVVHAGWIELKGVLSGHSEHQILVETERGEDLSMKTYREALAMILSDPLRTILQNQFAQIQQGHDKIRNLRDSTAHQAPPEEKTRTA